MIDDITFKKSCDKVVNYATVSIIIFSIITLGIMVFGNIKTADDLKWYYMIPIYLMQVCCGMIYTVILLRILIDRTSTKKEA